MDEDQLELKRNSIEVTDENYCNVDDELLYNEMDALVDIQTPLSYINQLLTSVSKRSRRDEEQERENPYKLTGDSFMDDENQEKSNYYTMLNLKQDPITRNVPNEPPYQMIKELPDNYVNKPIYFKEEHNSPLQASSFEQNLDDNDYESIDDIKISTTLETGHYEELDTSNDVPQVDSKSSEELNMYNLLPVRRLNIKQKSGLIRTQNGNFGLKITAKSDLKQDSLLQNKDTGTKIAACLEDEKSEAQSENIKEELSSKKQVTPSGRHIEERNYENDSANFVGCTNYHSERKDQKRDENFRGICHSYNGFFPKSESTKTKMKPEKEEPKQEIKRNNTVSRMRSKLRRPRAIMLSGSVKKKHEEPKDHLNNSATPLLETGSYGQIVKKHAAKNSDELSVDKGTKVLILKPPQDGWVYIEAFGVRGFIPKKKIAPL